MPPRRHDARAPGVILLGLLLGETCIREGGVREARIRERCIAEARIGIIRVGVFLLGIVRGCAASAGKIRSGKPASWKDRAAGDSGWYAAGRNWAPWLGSGAAG